MRRIHGSLTLAAIAWSWSTCACRGELIFDWTNRVAAGFTATEEAVVDAAFTIWRDLLPTPEPRTIALDIARASLPGAAAQAFNYRFDPLGNPVGASIEINAAMPFFIDLTPLDNNEYVASGHPAHFVALPGGPADGQWDLLSVVVHELGHALGLARTFFAVGSPPSGLFYGQFASRLTPGSNGTEFVYHGEDFTAELANGGHLRDDFDLMGFPGFSSAERALPSPIDMAILNDAFDYEDTAMFHAVMLPTALTDVSTTLIPIVVDERHTIADLDVAIYAQHSFTADLDISLISPNGTTVELSSANGLFVDEDPRMPPVGWVRWDIGVPGGWTRFDDESIASHIAATQVFTEVVPFYLPFAGTYAPEDPLAAFDGESTLGTWTLEVADRYSGDSGILLGFSLIFTTLAPTPLPGDFNGDGVVDAADLGVWQANIGTGTTFSQGDGDGDSDVDGADFLAWQRQLGSTAGLATELSRVVPEPHSAILVVMFVISLNLGSRRRLEAVS